MKVFRSLSCEAKVAAASDFHLSKYILYTYTKKVFSEIRVPPLYGHFINYCEIEMEVFNCLYTYQNRSLFKSATPPFQTALTLSYNTCNTKTTLKKKNSVPSVAKLLKQRSKRKNFNLPTLAAPLGIIAKMLLGTSKGSPRVIPGSWDPTGRIVCLLASSQTGADQKWRKRARHSSSKKTIWRWD